MGGLRKQFKAIQGDSTRYQGRTLAQQLQNAVEDETSVHCEVTVTPHTVIITAETLADYYLAASVVRKRTGLEVVRG